MYNDGSILNNMTLNFSINCFIILYNTATMPTYLKITYSFSIIFTEFVKNYSTFE